mgnify:CR=1 FL=1
MIPRIGSCFAQKKLEEVKAYLYKSYQYVWAVAIPMSFGLIGISDNLVPWFLGADYAKVSLLLKILALLLISIGINTITGNEYLIPTNRQNLYTKTVLLGAAVNVCFNALLIPSLMSTGAAIASVLAETVIAVYQLYLVKHELSILEILKRSWKYICAGALMLIVLRIENGCFAPSPLYTACMIITGIALYGGSLLVLRDKFVIDHIKAGFKLWN